ncbi:MAG TPA: CpaF family protein [Blastocatellia bacterium]|nr:CpaF family protein [Blastocatellia bacterium]
MASLKDRLEQERKYSRGTVSNEYQELKARVHRLLIPRLPLAKLETADVTEKQTKVNDYINIILSKEKLVLSAIDRERLQTEVYDELFGFGPLEPLLADKTISDILVNGYNNVYIERAGLLEQIEASFKDDAHLLQIIDRIVSRIGRRIDESSPMVDARLPDGSRVNAIIPPLSLNGPVLSIRRFGVNPLTMDNLLDYETLTPEMAEFLDASTKSHLNVLISGGTGSGKTTLLNCLSAFIPPEERLVTIEDSAELRLQQPHVVRLETRPANIEGRGEITQRQLLRNALRMRPDRIIIGEVRGEEAIDMLQAMNTGHDGSMTTIHANSPRDALSRLETMVSIAGLRLSDRSMRQQISSAIDLVIQVTRLGDGTRKVSSISEITGMDDEVITMQELFSYRRTGLGRHGEVRGYFTAAGIVPKCNEKLAVYGYDLSELTVAER